jgi:hypothetical protein
MKCVVDIKTPYIVSLPIPDGMSWSELQWRERLHWCVNHQSTVKLFWFFKRESTFTYDISSWYYEVYQFEKEEDAMWFKLRFS